MNVHKTKRLHNGALLLFRCNETSSNLSADRQTSTEFQLNQLISDKTGEGESAID